MQVLRLLAPRRAAPMPVTDSEPEDDGPFFDLDFSSSRCSSVRASSSSAGSASGSESDDASFADLDIVISLHRSRSASPPPLPKLCASEPGADPRTLSFDGAKIKKAAFHRGRRSFARSSSGARSLRLFVESPASGEDEAARPRRAAPSGDVFRRYLTKISRRLRRVRPRAAGEASRLRKSRSAAAALPSRRRDDSLIEKQDGIASAIAHCKESLHRASVSECESSLSRSRSDPGKRT